MAGKNDPNSKLRVWSEQKDSKKINLFFGFLEFINTCNFCWLYFQIDGKYFVSQLGSAVALLECGLMRIRGTIRPPFCPSAGSLSASPSEHSVVP